jgi:DnaK suppressor protein
MTPERARQLLDDEEARLQKLADAEKERLTESLEDSTGELTAFDQHPADLGTETHDRELDESLRQSLDAELDAVRSARTRLEKGEYGLCKTCGMEIPDERLEAMPATRYCVEHQAQREDELGATRH